MSKRISFSHLENRYIHEMRNKISNSEDRIDLENHFSYVLTGLLSSAFEEEKISIKTDDVTFDSGAKNYYTLSSRLMDSPEFKEKWDNSDIPDIVRRFADSAYRRYVHLDKNPAKAEKKIRK